MHGWCGAVGDGDGVPRACPTERCPPLARAPSPALPLLIATRPDPLASLARAMSKRAKLAASGTPSIASAFSSIATPNQATSSDASDALAKYKASVAKMKAAAKQRAQMNQSRTPGSWAAADDKWLWEHRHEPISELGRHLMRGDGAIASRLKHLNDPSHAAFQRLRGTEPPPTTIASTKRLLSCAQLNSEQRQAVALASEGKNVFLTGGAGTGKSFTLVHVITALQQLHGKGSVFVTGSTGIASCHINGTTLHSFSGIGLGKEDVQTLVARVSANRNASQRWLEAKALVIDEVSMLDGDLFDKIEAIGRHMVDPTKPFGGIQRACPRMPNRVPHLIPALS